MKDRIVEFVGVVRIERGAVFEGSRVGRWERVGCEGGMRRERAQVKASVGQTKGTAASKKTTATSVLFAAQEGDEKRGGGQKERGQDRERERRDRTEEGGDATFFRRVRVAS